MNFFCIQIERVIFFVLFLLPSLSFAQLINNSSNGVNANGTSQATAIQTAVPFLLITPDSRSGAMGEAGVALSPDANSNFWNPSKLAFIEAPDNISVSYSPWLRSLIPDVTLSYLGYAHKLDERNTIGASIRYFNVGTIQAYDNLQNFQGSFISSEYSIDASFARTFGEEFSLGLTARYIRSNLSNGYTSSGVTAKPGNALAADVSMYYKTQAQQFGKDALFSFGANISNIGTKISYSNDGTKYFLPTNLRIGIADMINLDDVNSVTFAFDINKLLVPTRPNSDISVPSGLFGSFTDASFTEEIQELSFSPGIEYLYNKLFALRVGYLYQNPNKGGLHYLTLGTGFKYQEFGFDFSYIAAGQQSSPLANTLRFTLSANFGSTTKQ
ncbi:MAG TPA: type IX secretion system outer membrane channel protein PorV [Mucilaginibacter sp.]|nr:type IX secretion system outer membrane channel protein PorV [Mucilaginibacter sp.]